MEEDCGGSQGLTKGDGDKGRRRRKHLHTKLVRIFIIHLHTKRNIPSCNGSLVIKQKTKQISYGRLVI
jgi:hypothetical protein